jgi:D-alanyl-D-alanine dipeptidase
MNSWKRPSGNDRRALVPIAVLCGLMLFGASALAQTKAAEPLLQVPIPEVSLTKMIYKDGNISIPFIGQYISGVYNFLISIVGIIAAVVMMVGGFQYLTAGGDKAKVDAGKERIRNALIGMALALGSYTILYIINPDLVRFGNLSFEEVQKIPIAEAELHDEGGSEGGEAVIKACSTEQECRALCAKPESTWPTRAVGMLDPKDAKPIPRMPGVSSVAGVTASQGVIDALKAAGAGAKSIKSSYEIVVTSGYRTLKRQIELVCDRIKSADAAKTPEAKKKLLDGLGKAVAWPGGSNHGVGYAVDVRLMDGDKAIVCSGCYEAQNKPEYQAPSKILDEIMTAKANFKRYSKEIWHFEAGGSASCRCRYPSCPWPPKC